MWGNMWGEITVQYCTALNTYFPALVQNSCVTLFGLVFIFSLFPLEKQNFLEEANILVEPSVCLPLRMCEIKYERRKKSSIKTRSYFSLTKVSFTATVNPMGLINQILLLSWILAIVNEWSAFHPSVQIILERRFVVHANDSDVCVCRTSTLRKWGRTRRWRRKPVGRWAEPEGVLVWLFFLLEKKKGGGRLSSFEKKKQKGKYESSFLIDVMVLKQSLNRY